MAGALAAGLSTWGRTSDEERTVGRPTRRDPVTATSPIIVWSSITNISALGSRTSNTARRLYKVSFHRRMTQAQWETQTRTHWQLPSLGKCLVRGQSPTPQPVAGPTLMNWALRLDINLLVLQVWFVSLPHVSLVDRCTYSFVVWPEVSLSERKTTSSITFELKIL